jgi:hypothetical protein
LRIQQRRANALCVPQNIEDPAARLSKTLFVDCDERTGGSALDEKLSEHPAWSLQTLEADHARAVQDMNGMKILLSVPDVKANRIHNAVGTGKRIRD